MTARTVIPLALAALLACACDEKPRGPVDAAVEEVAEEPVEVVDEPEEEPDLVDPVPDHPRIWLTPLLMDELELRQESSTPNAITIRDWCADHGEDDLASYVDSRGLGVLGAINYALLYKIQSSPTYAQRAAQIVEYALDNPYEGHTADTWIEFDDFHAARNLVPAVAIVLDWCWEALSESRRTRLVEQLDSWAARMMAAEPPGWQDPSSHDFYGHMWALLAAGYAIWGHSPDAETYIAHARDVMLAEGVKYASGEEVAWPVWDSSTGRANGGMWNEGTLHGNASSEHLFSAMLAELSAEGIVHEGFDFTAEVVGFNIHATCPGGGCTHAEGDGALGAIGPAVRIPVLMAMALSDASTRGRGQYWVDEATTATTTATPYRLFSEFIWYDEDQVGVDYRPAIGNSLYAAGTQTLLWRDGWGDDALWITMRIGLLGTDAAHNGLGHFTVYKNGWLVADRGVEDADGSLYEDLHHNVLYVPPADPGDEGRLYWGASTIEHLTANMAYVYLAGDMTDVYSAQPSSRANTVSHKERELFLVSSAKTLLVMDRGASFDAAHDKIFQLHFASDPVDESGDYRASGTGADLVVHTAHPAGASGTVDTAEGHRLRITTTDSTTAKSFLHVLRVVDAGADPLFIPLSSTEAEVVGAALGSSDGSADTVVTFSDDPEGDPPAAGSWTLSFDLTGTLVRCFFLDLDPATTYYVVHALTGSTLDIMVSTTDPGSAASHAANEHGIISFEFTPE
ncbi:MAG: hypothetical protein JRG91_04145 [Deltaproteobacteria bacterium]|nr:hypothetical protein [Deltaproteobacteria bacterium]